MKYKLETIWTEVVVVCFKVLSPHLPGQNEESHKMHYAGQSVCWAIYEAGTSLLRSEVQTSHSVTVHKHAAPAVASHKRDVAEFGCQIHTEAAPPPPQRHTPQCSHTCSHHMKTRNVKRLPSFHPTRKVQFRQLV
jgi:hypothetical protein